MSVSWKALNNSGVEANEQGDYREAERLLLAA